MLPPTCAPSPTTSRKCRRSMPSPSGRLTRMIFGMRWRLLKTVQRPTTRCVPPKTDEQLDLQALHRVRYRLVGQRTAIINQIRCFLLEHGLTVRQRLHWLRHALPDILAQRPDVLSPRMVRILEDLAQDWRRLDDRIEAVTGEIEALSKNA